MEVHVVSPIGAAAPSPARSALGLTVVSYTDPTVGAGTLIKRAHVQEIRDGIK